MLRTEISRILPSADKWAVEFTTYDGPTRQYERVCGRVISGALFATAELAAQAGDRALQVLRETRRFPDMCKPF